MINSAVRVSECSGVSRCQESLGVGVESLKECIQRFVASGIGPRKAVMFLKLKALKVCSLMRAKALGQFFLRGAQMIQEELCNFVQN